MSNKPQPEAAAASAPKPVLYKLNGKDYTADEYPKAFAMHVADQRRAAEEAAKPSAKPAT